MSTAFNRTLTRHEDGWRWPDGSREDKVSDQTFDKLHDFGIRSNKFVEVPVFEAESDLNIGLGGSQRLYAVICCHTRAYKVEQLRRHISWETARANDHEALQRRDPVAVAKMSGAGVSLNRAPMSTPACTSSGSRQVGMPRKPREFASRFRSVRRDWPEYWRARNHRTRFSSFKAGMKPRGRDGNCHANLNLWTSSRCRRRFRLCQARSIRSLCSPTE